MRALWRTAAKWMPRKLLPTSGCTRDPPNQQATISLIDDWITIFPEHTGINSGGYAPLFVENLVPWGVNRLGGVDGKTVLELGPLEAAHTYQLDKFGARSITAIEANRRSYLKCLLTKETMGIPSARFLFGNFLPWLEQHPEKFDVIWASGVLYHMTDPLTLLQLLAARTDRLFLWTHYFPDGGNTFRLPFIGSRAIPFHGRDIVYYKRLYLRPRWRALACGGINASSTWLRRNDIIFILNALGFSSVEIGFEDCRMPYRYSMAITARRPPP